jgi:acetyltransferase
MSTHRLDKLFRPYPKEWERNLVLEDGRRVFVRPVRPQDEDLVVEFFRHVTVEDLRLRFFAAVRDFSHDFIARLIQIDYERAIAFIAIDAEDGAMMGAVRLQVDADHEAGEYAILVRSDLKGRGLGWGLMQLMIEWARVEGLRVVEGQVLRENTTMLDMCRRLGFTIRSETGEPDIMRVRLAIGQMGEVGPLPA